MQNGGKMIRHRRRHGPLILAIARINMKHGNAPGIFLIWIQGDAVFRPGQTFALGFHRKVVRDLLTYSGAPVIPKFRQEKGVTVHFLAAVAVETVTAKKVRVAISGAFGIDVLWNEKPAGSTNRFTLRGTKARNITSGTLDGEMVHQVSAQNSVGIPYSVRIGRRLRMEKDAGGLERGSGN